MKITMSWAWETTRHIFWLRCHIYTSPNAKRGGKNKDIRSFWHINLHQTSNTLQLLAKLTSILTWKSYLTQYLLPYTICLYFNKILQGRPKVRKTLIKQNNHQNQTQIWLRCWNCQTYNSKQIMINMWKTLMEEVDNT